MLRVRSADEILSTLDSDGTVDGLLFMPEMLKYAGREFRVEASAHKTCDGASGIRQMDRTVHLAGLKCDGSALGGCQAGCLLFWREEWLRSATEAQTDDTIITEDTVETLARNTRLQTRTANPSIGVKPLISAERLTVPGTGTGARTPVVDVSPSDSSLKFVQKTRSSRRLARRTGIGTCDSTRR